MQSDQLAKLKEVAVKEEVLIDAEKAAFDAKPTDSAMAAAGEAAKTSAEGSLTGVVLPGAGGSSGSSAIPVLVSGGGVIGAEVSTMWSAVLNFCSPLFVWTKALVRWIVVVMYGLWVFREMDNKLVASMLLPQAKGNAVVGGTGAQVTGLAAAALISGVLLTVPAALWAAYQTPWGGLAGGISSMGSVPSSGFGEIVDRGFQWANLMLPLDLLAVLPPLVVTVRKAGWAVILGVAALIRFVVP
jgi:hypothetical protein